MAENENPKKDSGYTVKQIEGKVKKYGLEIALVVMFILSAIFPLVWGGAWVVWSIILCMIFAIIGVLVPRSTHKLTSHALQFIYKEKVTSIAIAIVGVLITIFLTPVFFAIIGLMAGKTFSLDARMEGSSLEPTEKDD